MTERNATVLADYEEHPDKWKYEPCAEEHTPGQVCILPVGHPVEDIPQSLFDLLDKHQPEHHSDGDYGEKQWLECTCGEDYGPDIVVGYNFKNPMESEMQVWKQHRNQKVERYISEAILSPDFIKAAEASPHTEVKFVLAAAYARIIGGDR
jgi:hypothetical protein